MTKQLRSLFVAALALVATAAMAQTEVVINFDNDYATLFPTLAGTSSGTGDTAVHDGDFTETTTSTPVSGVTVTVSAKTAGNNENRIWSSSPRLRLYSGSLTVNGTDITKIVFETGSNFNIDAANVSTGTLTEKTWVGKANEVVFPVTKNTQIKKITVTLGGATEDPADVEKTLFSDALTSASDSKFTIDTKSKDDALDYVWSFTSSYGAKASAYVGGTGYASEAWLISPTFDLANATEAKISFSHAVNKFGSVDNAKANTAVLVKVNGGDWTPVEVAYPESESWTFIDVTLDAAQYQGKQIQLAYKYTSTSAVCGTWEVKNFAIKGKGELAVIEAEKPVVPVASIADMANQPLGTKVVLTLTNAKVTFANGTYCYLRENGAGLCLHGQADFANAANTQTLNGTLEGTVDFYNKALQMNVTSAAGLTVSEGAAYQPVAITTDEAPAHYADLVVLPGANTIVADGTNFYASEDKDLQIYDTFKLGYTLTEGQVINDLTGIVVRYNDKWELAPIAVDFTNGIETIERNSRNDAPRYNLNGQRISSQAKGLYIQNGKKYVK